MGPTLRRSSALAVILACGVLAACGSDDTPTETSASTPEPAATQEAATGGGEIAVKAVEGGGGLSFDPAELTAAAGSVTITMENPAGNTMPHTVAIEGNGVEASGDAVEAGNSSTTTADLEAGSYTFYCPVGQHRQNGMEGTLTVE
jgi:plastocyanin